MSEFVHYQLEGHIATITYDRPEALNALSRQMRQESDEALARFRDDPEAWVGILTAKGRAFTAGFDVREEQPEDEFHVEPAHRMLTSLETGLELWKPMIAAIDGLCVGLGVSTVGACDFVIASDRASFWYPEVRAGIPAVLGSVWMTKRLGWTAAMELVLVGEPVSAQRAKELGLVSKVVPPDELESEARNLAERLALSAPLAVQACKEVAWRSMQFGLIDALSYGESKSRVLKESEDAKLFRAVARDKQTPKWTGR